ncbi:hypothetical protein [Nostoc sphaeroides]|uniref:Ribosome assembly protein 4 n=1 Tax=Nostoc sphaeroides CCNUC1 TaxID=2653204 RepID=A0A5P8VUB4_9NOSO|nr:hypothetical protein [Nostoc sphaeroides]QFS43977.1 ribosome assembly protein 4 [Nostoc sphaeroides CCNUC1]
MQIIYAVLLDDINGAVEKFGKAQQWDNKLKFDSQARAKELAAR